MTVFYLWKYIPAMIASVVCSAGAQSINWYIPPPLANLTSTGQNMDAMFQFQLGVFSGGFVPTAGNMARWAEFWVSADSTSYNPTSKVFDDTFLVTANPAPFTAGAKAYIWGRSAGPAKDEWILFRKSDWNWPVADPMSPFEITWNIASANATNEVILGTITPGGSPFLMKSEAVQSYAQWRDATLAGMPLNGPNDDPDRDSVSNLLEFVFGTSPAQAAATPATPTSFVEVSGQSYLQISIPRLRNRLATMTVEVSSNLIQWNSGSAFTTEVSNSAETLVVRDKTASGAGLPQRFMRLKTVTQP